ncbi:uncharacterized protein BJ171DRAFT_584782 [Polychytrium aggregatum]|uniref:uncharacterized protein n=1 Tax=Polychytrium aggregatum TaxID=110093 RepID=UPI0022FDE966|nr:uncharacterized protein BJ171DRAFT_584782 [Polychytrium aggregatum]KAI9201886.1 hypothetical protein BJ171DRAFT_584782 [Polychytrium aggregatum]
MTSPSSNESTPLLHHHRDRSHADPHAEPQVGLRSRLWNAFSLAVVGTGLAWIVFLALSRNRQAELLFQIHVYSMALSFVVITSAISYFQRLSADDRLEGIRHHGLLQTLGVLLMLSGFAAIVWNKLKNGKGHFAQAHSQLGLLAVVLCTAVFVVGIVSLALGRGETSARTVRVLKSVHRLAGYLTFVSVAATIAAVVWSGWARRNLSELEQYGWLAASIAVGGAVVLRAEWGRLFASLIPNDDDNEDEL